MKCRIKQAFGVLMTIGALGFTQVLQAEPLSEYVQACKEALGISTIPGYTCDKNTWPVRTESIPEATHGSVDSDNNYLGRVTFSEDPNIDAIFLCRDVETNSNGEKTAQLNGYIIQHRITGETCFFDAVPGSSATVPNLDADNASDYWVRPEAMAGTCHQCHSNDPFIVTEALSEAAKSLDIIENGRNLLGNYEIVGSDIPGSHFEGWTQDINRWISQNTENCADSCHKLTDTPFINGQISQAKNGGYMSPILSSYQVDDPLEKNDNYAIQNYWKSFWYLTTKSGRIEASIKGDKPLNAEWTFEKVGFEQNGEYYWIKNVANPNEFLHMSNGVLKSGSIRSGWWAAQWEFIKLDVPHQSGADDIASSIYHIRNRWTGDYLHVQDRALTASDIELFWWSARWYFNKL